MRAQNVVAVSHDKANKPGAAEAAELQEKILNTIFWLGLITLIHTASDIMSSADDPWAARLTDFYLEALPVPFVLSLGYFGTKHRDRVQLMLYMVTACWRTFASGGVAAAYFFEQEETCPSGNSQTCTAYATGAVCTPSKVCKTLDEISDCELDPACSMDDINGGLK